MTDRIHALLLGLVAVVQGSKSALLLCDPKGAYPTPLRESESPVRVTPKQAATHLRRYIKTAVTEAQSYSPAQGIPAGASDLTGFSSAINMTYTLSRGKRKGTQVPLLAYTLNRVRRAERYEASRQANAAAIAVATEAGTLWYAEGVERAFPNETKARKAWAREQHGGNWWANADGSMLPKEQRAAILAAAVVQIGEFTESSVATAPTAKVTKAMLVEQVVACGYSEAAAKRMKKAQLVTLAAALSALD